MKRKLLVMLISACMVMSLAGCGSEASSVLAEEKEETDKADSDGIITIGFSQVGAESDWRTANSISMKDTFSEANGYELIFDDARQNQENQIEAIRNFIQQEVDYIVLAPVTETGWDTVLQEAKDAGIPVIIVDRMVDVKDSSLYIAWIGSYFEYEGQKAAAWLDAYLKSVGRDQDQIGIVDIQGTMGATAQIGRTAGLTQAIHEHTNWRLLAKETSEYTEAKGREVMEDMLRKYGDKINVVYSENDNAAFGAIEAIEAAGKTVGPNGDILVISFDATQAGLTKVLDGKITCDVECNPLHGPRVEEIIQKLESGITPEKQEYVTEDIFAGVDNVKSITVDGKTSQVIRVTNDIIDSRPY